MDVTVGLARQNATRAGGLWLAAAGALVLAACATTAPAPVVDLTEDSGGAVARAATGEAGRTAQGVYRVASGDTLYAIAFRNGLDYRDIAAWNGIEAPYRIYPGEELRLTPPPASARIVAAPAEPAPARTSALGAAAAASPPAAKRQALFENVPSEPAPAASSAPPPTAGANARTAASATASGAAAGAGATETAAAPPPPAVVADSVATGKGGVAWRWPGKGTLISTFVAGDPTRQGIDIAGKAGDPVLAAAAGEVVYSGNGLLGYGELIIVKHNASYLSAYGHNRKRLVQEGQRVVAGQQIAEMGSSGASRDELHFEIRRNGKPVNPLDYLPAR